MKLLFVYNPHSGVGKIKFHLSDILEVMVRAGYEVTVHPTQARGDAAELAAQRAQAYDLVVCCGGDGTLDETVTGLMRGACGVPLGYIPAGSTNDFAASLGLPKDMRRAAEIAVSGTDFSCDVGRFGDDYFVYIAAFGLFTDVSYQTSQELKNVLGHAAYLLEGAKRIGSHPSFRMRVEYARRPEGVRNGPGAVESAAVFAACGCDAGKMIMGDAKGLASVPAEYVAVEGGFHAPASVEWEVVEGEFIFGMVTNSVSVGGFKGMTGKDVSLDDGLFEVTLIKTPRNPAELNEIIACLTNLRAESELICFFKTDALRISPEQPVPWTLDGEFGGEQTQIEIRNQHRALNIRVEAAATQRRV